MMASRTASLPPWFRGFLARYKRQVLIALALGLTAFGCTALLMFTSGYLISSTALAGTTLFSIMIPVACVQLFGFGRPLARYLERLVSHDWVLHVTSDLRLKLFRSIARRTDKPDLARATGEYLGLLADDVAHLQNLYLRVVFPTVVAYLLAVGAALFFGFFSLPFAFVVLLSLVLVVVFLPWCSLLASRAFMERVKSEKSQEYANLADDVYGALDWVLAGRGGDAINGHSQADAQMRAQEANARMRQRVFSLVVVLLLVVLLCGIVVWAGTLFGSDAAGPASTATVNWICAFALGFFPLIESFAMLPVALSESTTQLSSVRRLDEYLDESDADSAHRAETQEDAGGADAVLGEPGRIELRDVSYAYPGSSRLALRNLTLAIHSGESVAVLGRSGAGKSTFADVLRGALAPNGGTVRISFSDASGSEELGRDGAPYAAAVGFVGQTPYLFNRTLRENLTLGVNEASDERLIRVLESVGLGARFELLSDGLDTVIGETGMGFSGGEAHRIAIARVLVANTPIVIVDEPFSALDPETERDLLDTLLRSCKGRTLIVITHHLAEIERFDRVIFIEDGSVDLDGAPAKLLATSPRFRSLVAFDRM